VEVCAAKKVCPVFNKYEKCPLRSLVRQSLESMQMLFFILPSVCPDFNNEMWSSTVLCLIVKKLFNQHR